MTTLATYLDIPGNIGTRTYFIDCLRGLKGQNTFAELLLDPFVCADFIKDLKDLYPAVKDAMDPDVAGMYGFFLFQRVADDYTLSKNRSELESIRGEANRYLSEPSTVAFIMGRFEINPDFRPLKALLHAVGTTSYILRIAGVQKEGRQNKEFVLKLLKLRYHDNKSIRDATASYSNKYTGDSVHAPTIHKSDRFYIVMDFVPGYTLREYIASHLNVEEKDEGGMFLRLEKISHVMGLLCDALEYFYQHSIYHHDLSPDNIIVSDVQGSRKVTLIDFGENYVLKERVGSVLAFARASRYLPPEMLDSNSREQFRFSDYYSLGVILLDMLDSTRNLGDDISIMMELVWLKYPDFARLIDELLEPNHADRGANFGDEGLMRIKKRIELAFRLYSEIIDSAKGDPDLGQVLSRQGFWAALGRMVFKQIYRMNLRIKSLARQDQGSADEKYLLRWATVTEVAHVVVLAVFAILTLYDLHVTTKWGILRHVFFDLDLSAVTSGNLVANLPGRLVGISFSFLARRYYLNIFSTIRSCRGYPIAEFTLRFNAFCFSLPILWAMFSPKHWPYCSAVGVFFVALNNNAIKSLMIDAQRAVFANRKQPIPRMLSTFLETFREWWVLMIVYSIGLVIIGVLLTTGIAQDEYVYALIVGFFMNYLKMYVHNCSRDAPRIRAAVDRYNSCLVILKKRASIVN